VSNLVDHIPGGSLAWLQELGRRLATRRHMPDSDGNGVAPITAARDQGTSERILIVELGGWRCGALPGRLAKAGYQARIVRGVPAALDSRRQEPVSLCIVGGSVDSAACHTLRQALSAPVTVRRARSASKRCWHASALFCGIMPIR